MKRYSAISGLLILYIPSVCCQEVTGKIKLEQNQVLDISLKLKTSVAQQAGGQSIDFNVDAAGNHTYRVTNSTDETSTLHHKLNRIMFSFEGMGPKRNFDSNEEKDISGPFGKPIKEMLGKTYDLIIDTTGKTLMVFPEKITFNDMDNQMALISSLLKDVIDLVQPPQKGKGSFFKILPDSTITKGGTWTESYSNGNGNVNTAYVLTDVTDSTLVIDFVSNSVTVTKAMMMGSETTTTMSNKSSGKIILDKNSGIIREKTVNTDSNGTTESAFGNLPVISKTSAVISVLSSIPE